VKNRIVGAELEFRDIRAGFRVDGLDGLFIVGGEFYFVFLANFKLFWHIELFGYIVEYRGGFYFFYKITAAAEYARDFHGFLFGAERVRVSFFLHERFDERAQAVEIVRF